MPSRLDQTMGDQGNQEAPEEYVPQVAQWGTTVKVDPSKLSFPRLTLAQGLSSEVTKDGATARMGDWLLPSYAEVKEVTFVPMKHGLSRRLPLYDNNGKAMVVEGKYENECYAPIVPEEELLHGIGDPGIPCLECPFSDWQPRPESHGFKGNWQPCILSYDFVGWSVTHESPVQVSLNKTSAPAGRMLQMLGYTRGLGNFMVKLVSERRTNKAGNTYAVAKIQMLPADSEMLETANLYLGIPEKAQSAQAAD